MSFDSWLGLLRCPDDGGHLKLERDCLRCETGHSIPVVQGIPQLVRPRLPAERDAWWERFYDRAAPTYDLSERLGGRLLLGLDMRAERAAIVEHLNLRRGSRLLEVSPGPGVYQGLLARALGAGGALAEADLSLGMLRACARQAHRTGLDPLLVQANAAFLPFADESFDHVFHFGGVKLFSEPARALREMVRVAKRGATVAWGDEGFGATAPRGWRTDLLKRMNPGFAEPQPPVPEGLRVDGQYEVMGGCAWLTVATRI